MGGADKRQRHGSGARCVGQRFGPATPAAHSKASSVPPPCSPIPMPPLSPRPMRASSPTPAVPIWVAVLLVTATWGFGHVLDRGPGCLPSGQVVPSVRTLKCRTGWPPEFCFGERVGGGGEPKSPKVCVRKIAQINISFCKFHFFPTMKSGSEGRGVSPPTPIPQETLSCC